MTYVLTISSSGSRQKKFARASPRAVWMKIKQSIRRSTISQAGSGRMNESIRTKWAGIGRLARPTTRTAWKTKLSTDVSQAKLEAKYGQKLTRLTLHNGMGLLRWNSSNHKSQVSGDKSQSEWLSLRQPDFGDLLATVRIARKREFQIKFELLHAG